ncbi:alpha/beta fold hydrolase [candidate division KSB1 bacterium]|nr:alpha/beta fold hydrolase [candidate division KSB1 bacterium]RQW08443.1 MAG: alpha/beta fold hydrolase [candidate division KSB1 bacterium]
MKPIHILPFCLLCVGCHSASFHYSIAETDLSDDFVIILHGLRGKSSSFLKLEQALLAQGYNVCRVDYPSTQYDVQTLADRAIGEAIRRCERAGSDTLYFVAHSLGAILARHFLQENDLSRLGRIVFICPPNHGTELIDRFAWCRLFRKVNGPAGMQLSASPDGLVASLEIPDYPFAVVMSARSINPLASAFIPGRDDGRVSMESAKLTGMRDFVLVQAHHHNSMRKQETIRQVIHLLERGEFERTDCIAPQVR